ncbi:MAG: transglutaminase domain-containing protein [Spirochaetales bacterium]|nr:transglutaminase domain-containing protein [Spirochaetales bacterium]
MKPAKRLIWAIVSIAAGIAALVLIFLGSYPVLSNIQPVVFTPGETIRLRGKNFGQEQGQGLILLDGAPLTRSSYKSWNDEEILIVLPPSVDSALLQVAKPLGRSKASVVINSQRLPEKPADLPHAAPGPSIAQALPDEAGPGALIQLRGINFGSELHASQVRFTRNPGRMALEASKDSGLSLTASAAQQHVLPENSLMYEHWDDKLIQVRVPEEAGSGPVIVSTPHGVSEPYHIQVSQSSGSKYRFDPVSYSMEFQIDIERKDQNAGGSLQIHVPNPPASFFQSIGEVQSESHPSQGSLDAPASLIRLDSLQQGISSIRRTLLLTVYNVESELSSYSAGFTGPYSDPSVSGSPPLFLKPYVEADELVPSGEKETRTLAAAIVGRERNLQRKAGLIRTWLASRLDWLAEAEPGAAVIQDLVKRKAASRNYALIATALFRAAGIPAVPVAGLLVGDEGQGIPHFWMEYYLPAVGWIPYDPVLVYGAVPEGFTPPFIGPALYFGALDNRHIAVSRGFDTLHSRILQDSQSSGTVPWLFTEPLEEAFGLEYVREWKPVRILAY